MTVAPEHPDPARAFAAIQAVTSIFVAADTRDWAALRSRLADRARLRFYGTATHVLAVPGQEGRWVLGPATTPRSGTPRTGGGPPR